MKNTIYVPVTACLLSMLFIVNCNAQESFSHTYLEASKIESKVEGFNKEPDGYRILGSIQVNEISYLKMHYEKSTKEWSEANISNELELENYSFAIGLFDSISTNTDWYVELGAEKLTIDLPDSFDEEDDDEFSYSASLGLKTVQFEYLQLEASFKHLYNKDGSEFSSQLGAFYSLSNHVSIGVEKTFGADIDTLAATMRYSF